MPAEKKKEKTGAARMADKIVGFVLIAAIGAVLVWLVARSMTLMMNNGGIGADGINALIQKFPKAVSKHPFAIDWSYTEVKVSAAVAAGVLAAYAVTYLSKGMKLKNEDTMNAHGNARFATKREAAELIDEKHYCNNFFYGEGCGLTITPYDKRTKAKTQALNNNAITLGISGLGKSYNLCSYDIMQAVGDALPPKPYGIRNIPAHLMASKPVRAIAFVPEALGLLVGRGEDSASEAVEAPESPAEAENAPTEGAAAENAAQGNTDAPAAVPEAIEDVFFDGTPVPEAAEAGAESALEPEPVQGAGDKPAADEAASEAGKGRGKALPFGKRPKPEKGESALAGRLGAVRSAYGAKVSGKGKKTIDVTQGFDFVCTDPKGDLARDTCGMLEAAGYDVKIVNTLDFSQSLKINPLSSIGVQYVDLVAPERVEVKVSAKCVSAAGEVEELSSDEPLSVLAGTFTRNGHLMRLEPTMKMSTDTFSLADVPECSLSVEELDELLEDEALDPERRELLNRQRSVQWMKTAMGGTATDNGDGTSRLVGANGCPKIAQVVGNHRYRNTVGELVINYTWLEGQPAQEAQVVIEVPEYIVIDTYTKTCGELELVYDDKGRVVPGKPVTWRLDGMRPELDANGKAKTDQLVLRYHIKPFRVADGVQLTKVVDCLVSNLKGTGAADNGSEDPFWEDTKRLLVMSLIAYLFERYSDPRYWTIPEMVKLLDMAVSSTGDPSAVSKLDVLMQQWERGEIYIDTDERKTEGYRGARRGGKWMRTDNDKHSRDDSMALHCYYAIRNSAPDTYLSVLISVQAALSNLISAEVRDFLSKDELHLETLGDPGQKQAVFFIISDTDSPFDFVTALLCQEAISGAQEKAFKKYGGKLPRHVRFILDEVANIGKIPVLIRALAVVRSRNISISMFLQSKAQLAATYGDKQTDIVFDNCSTLVYLGAQSESTVEEMSKMLGEETVFSRTFQRNFGQTGTVGGSNESLNSTSRRLMSGSELRQMHKGKELVFVYNHKPALVNKNQTHKHPLYAYINPGDRSWLQPPAVFEERFDFVDYMKRHGLR